MSVLEKDDMKAHTILLSMVFGDNFLLFMGLLGHLKAMTKERIPLMSFLLQYLVPGHGYLSPVDLSFNHFVRLMMGKMKRRRIFLSLANRSSHHFMDAIFSCCLHFTASLNDATL